MEKIWIVTGLLSVAAGGVGYVFARRTGRNPVVWTLLCVVLNVFTIAAVSLAAGSRQTKAE